MSSLRHNPGLVKIHRSYTVEEIARLLTVHKNTVHKWIKQDGLAICDTARPALVHGSVLRLFLDAKRGKNKRQCQPGEMYCMKCRVPKRPAGGMADYQPGNANLGNLVGMCPDCLSIMNRRISVPKLPMILPHMNVMLPQALQHIVERSYPSVNSDLETGAKS